MCFIFSAGAMCFFSLFIVSLHLILFLKKSKGIIEARKGQGGLGV